MNRRLIALMLIAGFVLPLVGGSEVAAAPLPEPPTTSTTTNDAVAKHVRQLGSSVFEERKAAAEALEAIGAPALEALRKAAKSEDAEVAGQANRLIRRIENSLDQLLSLYREYELPLPPADAKLVRFESGGRYVNNGELMPPTYFLGFLLQAKTADAPARLLVGTHEQTLNEFLDVEFVEPRAELVDGIEGSYWGSAPFNMNDALVIALQCHARGWKPLAERLWQLGIRHDSGDVFGAFYQPRDVPNRTALLYAVWMHYGNELAKPGTDRAKIAERMKKVVAAEPRLNTEAQQSLLKSLDLTLAAPVSPPGSVKRLVDDLSEMHNIGRDRDDKDPRYARLADLGFAAVPDLLDHLDDERLTRSVQPGMMNSPTYHRTIGEVVSQLLRELAGESTDSWRHPPSRSHFTYEAEDVRTWWDHVKQEGEEAYCVKHVLPTNKKDEWPEDRLLALIAKKYPQHLPKIYRTILDERPSMQSWPVAEAVAKSSLVDETKRELFLHAARNSNLEHRRAGLRELQKYDPQQFLEQLLSTLESLPPTPKEAYWKCREAAFTHLVMATDDDRAWTTLLKVANRSDVGLRMEFMNPMNYSYAENRLLQRRLDFLAAFLDDDAAPDIEANPGMFDGPHAGFTFKRLEVRDLAAAKIASLLKMRENPDMNWTPEQWSRLREQVKQRLAKK